MRDHVENLPEGGGEEELADVLRETLVQLRAYLRSDIELMAPESPDTFREIADPDELNLIGPPLDLVRRTEALLGRPADGQPAWLDAAIDSDWLRGCVDA